MDIQNALTAIPSANAENLEALRIQYLGHNGALTAQMKELGKLDPEARKAKGAELNVIKTQLTAAITTRKEELETESLNAKLAEETIDVSLPADPTYNGRIHPLTAAMEDIAAALRSLGFTHAYGPEVETDEYNFTKLNLPAHHPARQDQDTFYINPFATGKNEALNAETQRHVLRTQTSNVQVRSLETVQPPFRVMGIGRVYRRDYDLTHTPQFHQVEGMMVESGTTFANMRGVLDEFLRIYFGKQLKTRMRPHYFPFTEPSAEMDMECHLCKGAGCRVCKQTGWLEILGCGMVHRNVLAVGGLDIEQHQGFAFGAGVERLAMLKYGVPDLRLFYESYAAFLRQYGKAPVSAA
ncbi:MAG: phenylalanine--tRNA ligase subunit alpha [Hyphomicrobiales bacterium]|nr:MAG: phenylalanine--tRNA ligase subunit alpha [Hyphomicrobiales bacterium]